MSIEQLIAEIADRPAMYLGEATRSRLDAFLLGWTLKSVDADTSAKMLGFQRWIEDRYQVNTSHSWANIIRFYSHNDVAALEEALTLFQEYFAKHRLESQPPREDR